MIEFQLFRIKVFPPVQEDFFRKKMSRSEILKQALLSLPSKELRKGAIWRVGNVKELDDNAAYFRIGRTLSSKVEVYQDGEFIEKEFESAPYTHVLIDLNTELCAIAKKTKLAPKTISVARQFIRLIGKTKVAEDSGAVFQVNEVSDPEDFISYLKKAHSITKFWITFTRPNAFDVNQDFVKPMQRYLEETCADKGKAEISGNGLDVNNLEELARSAAATGDDAIAEMKGSEKGKKVRKYLRGKSVTVPVDSFDDIDQKKSVMQRIRDIYKKLRHDE